MKSVLTKNKKTTIVNGNEMWSGDHSSFTGLHYLVNLDNGGLLYV